MIQLKDLEHKSLGYLRNSTDKYGVALVTALLEEIKLRDKEIEELKNASVRVVYKEHERSSWEKEWDANPQDRHLFGK